MLSTDSAATANGLCCCAAGFADEASVTKEAFDFYDSLTKQGKKVRVRVGLC